MTNALKKELNFLTYIKPKSCKISVFIHKSQNQLLEKAISLVRSPLLSCGYIREICKILQLCQDFVEMANNEKD